MKNHSFTGSGSRDILLGQTTAAAGMRIKGQRSIVPFVIIRAYQNAFPTRKIITIRA